MSRLLVRGGKPLRGEITLAGAKNATTKLMVASLLTDEPCLLENFPNIGDAAITQELCEAFGSTVKRDAATCILHTPKITNTRAVSLSRRNRIPILALGPLLARAGEAEVPIVGGDKIGPRPVNLHLKALEAMGAKIEEGETSYRASAPQGLRGAAIRFEFPSVGATENAILAAVLAQGKTTLENAATEPEVLDVIKFLQKMGAIIELGANRLIVIEGVKKLRGARHRIMPDRNEAASFASLAAATGGRIFVRDARQDDLITFLNAFRRAGGEYEVRDNGIEFFRPVRGKPLTGLRAAQIETGTHPGFMTDWQQPFAVFLTQAEGRSTIHETIYEDRFGYAADLQLLGAKISVSAECAGTPCRFQGKGFLHSAAIEGPTSLRGGALKIRDLRSGIAHVIAALTAHGESIIEGVEELDRGYERIDERLRALGAEIRREV